MREKYYLSSVKKKIILLLSAGVVLSANKSLGKQWRIIGEVAKEWREINRMSLKRSLDSMYNSRLVSLKPKGDGFEIILSEQGKKISKRLDLENLQIPKQKNWDGKWRIVMFDIPEKIKKVREAVRFHFKSIGLVEYQKSVFIYPYPCEKEIKFIAEFYKVFPSIKFIVASATSDERKFLKEFDLK